jgi:hypothetical protein
MAATQAGAQHFVEVRVLAAAGAFVVENFRRLQAASDGFRRLQAASNGVMDVLGLKGFQLGGGVIFVTFS